MAAELVLTIVFGVIATVIGLVTIWQKVQIVQVKVESATLSHLTYSNAEPYILSYDWIVSPFIVKRWSERAVPPHTIVPERPILHRVALRPPHLHAGRHAGRLALH